MDLPQTDGAKAARQAGEEIRNEKLIALEKAGATFGKIARELCLIAFSDLKDYMHVAEGGEIQAIQFDEIRGRKTRALRKIRERTKITESSDGSRIFKESQIEYELYDKLDALKYLCKLRGDEPAQRQEHTFPDGIPMIPLDEESAAKLEAMKAVLKEKK